MPKAIALLLTGVLVSVLVYPAMSSVLQQRLGTFDLDRFLAGLIGFTGIWGTYFAYSHGAAQKNASSNEREREAQAESALRKSIVAEVQVELGIILGKLGVITTAGASYHDPAGLPHAALDNASANSGVLLPETAGSIIGVRHELEELSASINVLDAARRNSGAWVSMAGGRAVPPPWMPQATTVAEHAGRTRDAIAKLKAALVDEAKR